MKNKMKNKTKDMKNSYNKKNGGVSNESNEYNQTSDCGKPRDCHYGRKTK